VADAVIGDIIGHEHLKAADGSEITIVYSGSFPLENLHVAIHELNYDLDLSHINYKKFINMYSKEYKKLINEQKREDRKL